MAFNPVTGSALAGPLESLTQDDHRSSGARSRSGWPPPGSATDGGRPNLQVFPVAECAEIDRSANSRHQEYPTTRSGEP